MPSPDKVVLITGSSTGFGRAAAETLARKGYTVWASMRDTHGKNAAHTQALEAIARQEKLDLFPLEMDVTNEESVNAAVEAALSQSGRIDVVINNAGVAALGITEAYTLAQWQRLFDVNVFGVARVNRAVLPSMRRRRSGLLIHISSAAGRVVVAYSGIYCASKFALEALADSYRFELAPFGIDSVLVEPGIHRTPILENFAAPDDAERVAGYQPSADFTQRVKGVFDAANAAPETPDAGLVVDAFVHLIEMPPGERPFRTVPTPAVMPLLEQYNAAAAQVRERVAQGFNVSELTTLAKSSAASQ